MKTQGKFAALGKLLADLAAEHGAWSQATFGADDERGPTGALKHLQKEAGETIAAWAAPRFDSAALREEFADCLLLLLDAARRAGLNPLALLYAAKEKMAVNKARKWPAPVAGEPCEHVRD